MVGITSTGIGSGLDVQGLVSQLLAAEEQAPRQRLILRETQFQGQLSAYGSLSSALDTLKSALTKLDDGNATAGRTIKSSNEDAVSVSVDSAAVPGQYTVAISNLAQTERLTSASYASSQSVVGDGRLTLSIGGSSFSVDISAEANTLADIRNAINSANDNTGVQASIINADGASYLVFAGDSTGSENTITVTQSGGDGGLSALVYDPDDGTTSLTRSQAADDARAIVNGFSVSSATNSFDSVIDGVTFSAIQVTGTDSFTLDIENDTSGVKSSLTQFVNAYNTFVDRVDELAAFDPETNVAGALQGDSTLRNLTNIVRAELSQRTTSAADGFDTLTEIGLSLDESGKLSLDDERITNVLDNNFRAISEVFGGDSGYVTRLTSIVDTYTGTSGILKTREDGIKASIESLTQQNERLDLRLASLQTRLLNQFNGLDSLISSLNLTSNFLTTQLANVPTPGQRNT
ncbi:MAG: flagellar filament capping protein FliD [Pseudomonadota bacterium]